MKPNKMNNSEVHAWMVTMMTGNDRPDHRKRRESVFLTDGIDLGQLQREVELRFGSGGEIVEIIEIKALGAVGNCKA